MTRQEHIECCKRSALQHLPDDAGKALASMFSDLKKHPETAKHPAIQLGMELLLSGHLSNPEDCQSFIEGFA
jgi:hypothetical protein